MPSFPSRSLEGRRNGMEAMGAKRGHSLLLSVLPVGRPRASRKNRHPGIVWWTICAVCQGNLAARRARTGDAPEAPGSAGPRWGAKAWRPADLCHSKARAATVGERISHTFPWKLAPVTHWNSSDSTEITGRRQVRAPSLSLDRVSKHMQHGSGTLQ